MIMNLTITSEHIKEGNSRSTCDDPIAIAIKEKLSDYTLVRDIVAVGDNEIFLSHRGVNYIALFNGNTFYRYLEPGSKITLNFIPLGEKELALRK